MIKLKIDGKEVEARPGSTVLNAALSAGIYIPHLCDHPDLKPAGACRLCLVELEGMEGCHASCHLPATEGIEVLTATPRLLHLRRMAMELLLADHPEECSTCTKYLNCELQSLKQFLGVSEHLSVRRRPKHIPPISRIRCSTTTLPAALTAAGACAHATSCAEPKFSSLCIMARKTAPVSPSASPGKRRVPFLRRLRRGLPDRGVSWTSRSWYKAEGARRAASLPGQLPGRIDTMRYVRFMSEGKYAESAAVIREKVPLPLILGYVCVHPCEDVCRRNPVDSPISLRESEALRRRARYLADLETKCPQEPSTGKRVAVVGSGPAGLTAAYYLAKLGHACDRSRNCPRLEEC